MSEPVEDAARRFAVVVNAASGGALGDDDPVADLRRRFEQAGVEADFITTPDKLDDRVEAALARRPRALVIAGGDGSLTCAATQSIDTATPLAIVPLGTMNLLARDLGIPTDPDEAIRALGSAVPRTIDAGEVNGRLFLNGSMLGTPARLGRHRERARDLGGLRGMLHYTGALIAARRHHALRLRVTAGGRSKRMRTPAATVSVNALTDDTGRTFGRGRLDAGMMVAYLVRPIDAFAAIRLAMHVVIGRWPRSRAIEVIEGPGLTIETGGFQAIHVMNDGEVTLLKPPLAYRVRPRALTVLAPPVPDDGAATDAG